MKQHILTFLAVNEALNGAPVVTTDLVRTLPLKQDSAKDRGRVVRALRKLERAGFVEQGRSSDCHMSLLTWRPTDKAMRRAVKILCVTNVTH